MSGTPNYPFDPVLDIVNVDDVAEIVANMLEELGYPMLTPTDRVDLSGHLRRFFYGPDPEGR